MSSVVTPTQTLFYEYDIDGIKTKLDNGTNVSYYLIDKQQPYAQVIAEYDGSSSLKAEYVFGLERVSLTRNSLKHYYVADGQGSIRYLTDQSGNVTDTYIYYAFGDMYYQTGSTENEFQYVGEQLDPNTNFYYLRARWYNPQNGRFASIDPFPGDPQSPMSLHRYLYGNASPASFWDPAGRFTLASALMTAYLVGELANQPIVSYKISYGVGLFKRDVMIFGIETHTIIWDHHSVKIGTYYGKTHDDYEISSRAYSFRADNFINAIKEANNPFSKSGGWVPGNVGIEKTPGKCQMNTVTKNRYIIVKHRIITSKKQRPYHLYIYNCRHWAAEILR